MGDGLEEAPEERLREGSSVPLPAAAPGLRADVLALDAVDEDGLQGTAEEVGVPVLTGDHCVGRHVSLLQGLERLCQLLLDLHVTMRASGKMSPSFLVSFGQSNYTAVQTRSQLEKQLPGLPTNLEAQSRNRLARFLKRNAQIATLLCNIILRSPTVT